MLLGADIYFDLLTHGIISLGKQMPVLQNSLLGYLIAGNIPNTFSKSRSVACLNVNNTMDSYLDSNLVDDSNKLPVEYCFSFLSLGFK